MHPCEHPWQHVSSAHERTWHVGNPPLHGACLIMASLSHRRAGSLPPSLAHRRSSTALCFTAHKQTPRQTNPVDVRTRQYTLAALRDTVLANPKNETRDMDAIAKLS